MLRSDVHPELTAAELERRIAKGNLAYALLTMPDMPREKRDELVRKYIELSEPIGGDNAALAKLHGP